MEVLQMLFNLNVHIIFDIIGMEFPIPHKKKICKLEARIFSENEFDIYTGYYHNYLAQAVWLWPNSCFWEISFRGKLHFPSKLMKSLCCFTSGAVAL